MPQVLAHRRDGSVAFRYKNLSMKDATAKAERLARTGKYEDVHVISRRKIVKTFESKDYRGNPSYVPQPGWFILKRDMRSKAREKPVLVAYGPWPSRQLAYMRLAVLGAWDVRSDPDDRVVREWGMEPKNKWSVSGPYNEREIEYMTGDAKGDEPSIYWPRVEPAKNLKGSLDGWDRSKGREIWLDTLRRYAEYGGWDSMMQGIPTSAVTHKAIMEGGVWHD